jgi:ribosomal protein L19E
LPKSGLSKSWAEELENLESSILSKLGRPLQEDVSAMFHISSLEVRENLISHINNSPVIDACSRTRHQQQRVSKAAAKNKTGTHEISGQDREPANYRCVDADNVKVGRACRECLWELRDTQEARRTRHNGNSAFTTCFQPDFYATFAWRPSGQAADFARHNVAEDDNATLL